VPLVAQLGDSSDKQNISVLFGTARDESFEMASKSRRIPFEKGSTLSVATPVKPGPQSGSSMFLGGSPLTNLQQSTMSHGFGVAQVAATTAISYELQQRQF